MEDRKQISGADFLKLDTALEVADAVKDRLRTDDYRTSILENRLDVESFLLLKVEDLLSCFTVSRNEEDDKPVAKGDISKLRRLQAELREAAFTAQDPRLSDEVAAEMEVQKKGRATTPLSCSASSVQLAMDDTRDQVLMRSDTESAGAQTTAGADGRKPVEERRMEGSIARGAGGEGDANEENSGRPGAHSAEQQIEGDTPKRNRKELSADTLTEQELFSSLGRPGPALQHIVGVPTCRKLIRMQRDLRTETIARVQHHSLQQLQTFDWKGNKADQEFRDTIFQVVLKKQKGGVIQALGWDWVWPTKQKKLLKAQLETKSSIQQETEALYGSRIALYCTSDSEDSKSEVLVGEGSLTNASDNVILVKVDMVPEGLDCEKLLCEGDSLLDLGLAVGSEITWPRISDTTSWTGANDPDIQDPILKKRPKIASKTRSRCQQASVPAASRRGTKTKPPLHHASTAADKARPTARADPPIDTLPIAVERPPLMTLYPRNAFQRKRAQYTAKGLEPFPDMFWRILEDGAYESFPIKPKDMNPRVMGGEEVFEEMDVDRETLGTTLLTKAPGSTKAEGEGLLTKDRADDKDPPLFGEVPEPHEHEVPLETEVLKSKGKEPSGAIPGAKLQPGGHGALQATTERGVPNGTPGDPQGVGMRERPSQVGVPGKPPPPTVQQDQGRACVEDKQAPERERRVGGLQPVPRATIGKERPDTREPGPLGIAPQAGCEPSGAGRGVNRRGGKPPRPPAPKPKQAGGDGFEQGGGQQTGAALDKPSKRKASFVEGPNLEPGVTAKRPTPTPPAEKREDSALENSSGRGLRRNAKDQHSLVSHKPGCAGFKSGCNGCKLSGAMLEKASHVAEINIMGEDDSESDGGLDGDSDSGGPEEVKKSGGRSKPRGQAEDEERPRPISKELKTKYSVVCLQLLGAQTFSQLNTAALAMHLTKSYPEHFKGSLQRLKKLEQGQLLRIVAERAVTEGLVDIAAEADWRTSSQRLTKADVTLSQ